MVPSHHVVLLTAMVANRPTEHHTTDPVRHRPSLAATIYLLSRRRQEADTVARVRTAPGEVPRHQLLNTNSSTALTHHRRRPNSAVPAATTQNRPPSKTTLVTMATSMTELITRKRARTQLLRADMTLDVVAVAVDHSNSSNTRKTSIQEGYFLISCMVFSPGSIESMVNNPRNGSCLLPGDRQGLPISR